MGSSASRGRLTVNHDSWHYKVQQWWAKDKGRVRLNPKTEEYEPLPPSDLCHYFWQVVLWAPLRYFFLHGPAIVIGLVAGLAGIVIPLILWGGYILHGLWIGSEWALVVLGILLTAVLGGIVIVLLGKLALGWKTATVRRRLGKVEDGLMAAGRWFFQYPLVRTRWINLPPVVPVVIVLYALFLWYFSKAALIVLAIAGCVLLAGALIVILGVLFADISENRKLKKAEEARHTDTSGKIVYTEPRERWSGLKALWAFLVAKKHRFCPLIEVR